MSDSEEQKSDPKFSDSPGARGGVKHPVLRAVIFATGVLLILVGFMLGFVPFLPGFPFGLAGLALLAASSSRVRRQLRKLLRRLPKKWRAKIEPHLRPKR